MMSDVIKRQDAIDAIDKHIDTFDAIDTNYLCGLRTAMSFLKEMPSAEVRTQMSSADCISRQDAIDAIIRESTADGAYGYVDTKSSVDLIRKLPSAQPEQLTDKEQRIFLAAMERERKVCKQVDEEWRDCREPYEDSLVSVCNEIERKVKGALWGGK